MVQRILRWFQFTNIYIALSALLYSVASVRFTSNYSVPKLLLATIFLAVIWYYNLSYQKIIQQNKVDNERALWFLKHQKKLFTVQASLLSGIIIFGLLLSPNLVNFFTYTTTAQQLFLLSFLFIALLYNYGLIYKKSTFSIRKFAIFKPLFIAYVWMGVTVVFPFVFSQISNQKLLLFSNNFWIYFFDGLYSITLLAFIYDVKDFETDNTVGLKTFAVKLGNKKMLTYLVLPAVTLGFASVLLSVFFMNFPQTISLIFLFTYVAIAIVSKIIESKKSILWHLTLIDGIILLKAIAIIALINI